MADLGLPEPGGTADPRHAVELLRDVLVDAAAAGRPVTLVSLAPLTNVALLLRTYPQAAAGLARIVFMGGAALVGNATAAAEFNVRHDPEAAAVVLDAAVALEIPVTMYGLDVFYGPRVTRAQAAALTVSPGAAARLAGRLITFQCERFADDAATIGDAGAVCAVADPGGIRTRRLPVRVELAGAWTRGRAIVDQRDRSGELAPDPYGPAPAVADVALEVDGERYVRLWLSSLG